MIESIASAGDAEALVVLLFRVIEETEFRARLFLKRASRL